MIRLHFISTCSIALILFSCLPGNKKQNENLSKDGSIVDSLCFNYFKLPHEPYIAKVCSYALSDSASMILDSLRDESLYENFIHFGNNKQLKYSRIFDEITVDILHAVPQTERFFMGGLELKDDTFFLTFSGYVPRNMPSPDTLDENYHPWLRHYKTVFQIKSSDSVNYKIFYKD